jgi:hypothetical protein
LVEARTSVSTSTKLDHQVSIRTPAPKSAQPAREAARAPACRSLGGHCRDLPVTLSVADLEDDGATRDALATWLLGHGQRISFGTPYVRGRRVLVDAVVHVACKFLETEGNAWRRGGTDGREAGRVRCRAHGFTGCLPPTSPPAGPRHRRHPDGTLTLVHRGRERRLDLKSRTPRPRALPVVQNGGNPCVGAPCRTADNARGAACCRDLTLEVLAPAYERRSEHLEALLLARRAPYLCKTERVNEEILECEVISACGYLEDDGIGCALHDRVRPDGEPAKPYVCSEWPDLGPDDEGHPGCRLITQNGMTAKRHDGKTA